MLSRINSRPVRAVLHASRERRQFCATSAWTPPTVIAVTGGFAGIVGGGIALYTFFLPSLRESTAETQYVTYLEKQLLIKYRNAMLHELLSRDQFIRGSVFDAKRYLNFAITDFETLHTALAPDQDTAKSLRAQQILSKLCSHAIEQKFVEEGTSSEQFRWTILAGLATSLYHLAILKHMDGDEQKAQELLDRSASLSSSLHGAMQLDSPADGAKSPKFAELKQIAEWECQRVRTKAAALATPFEQLALAPQSGDAAFFAMRQKSMQSWNLTAQGEPERALGMMQSCRTYADKLVPASSLDHELVESLGNFKWPSCSQSREENICSMNGAGITALSKLWTDGIALVDVLHDMSRKKLEKAERVRLALRKQVSSRLSCVLLRLAAGDTSGAEKDWSAWKDYQSTCAFSVVKCVDKEWLDASERDAVCCALMGFVLRGEKLAPEYTQARNYPAFDWRWVCQCIHTLQHDGTVPDKCPKRWEAVARGVLTAAQ